MPQSEMIVLSQDCGVSITTDSLVLEKWPEGTTTKRTTCGTFAIVNITCRCARNSPRYCMIAAKRDDRVKMS